MVFTPTQQNPRTAWNATSISPTRYNARHPPERPFNPHRAYLPDLLGVRITLPYEVMRYQVDGDPYEITTVC